MKYFIFLIMFASCKEHTWRDDYKPMVVDRSNDTIPAYFIKHASTGWITRGDSIVRFP